MIQFFMLNFFHVVILSVVSHSFDGCELHLGIVVTAYSSLGAQLQNSPSLLKDEVIVSVANQTAKSPAQVPSLSSTTSLIYTGI